MLSGDFRTPNRADVSSELEVFADQVGAYLNFEEFMQRAEQEQIPFELAGLALKHCNGDFTEAYAELHPGSDPAVNMWHAGNVSLTGLNQQDTFHM